MVRQFLLKLIKKWFNCKFNNILYQLNNYFLRAQDELAQQQLELSNWCEKIQKDETIENSISGQIKFIKVVYKNFLELSLSSQSIDNTFMASCAEESKKNVYNNVNSMLQT